ncbi:MAG: sigma-70 family RNA polymerase sigma factor [Pseudomonadota bacterium]|nr:sigma-70 family RNA polymerase sigma factor [Pseudomonadota bacterium]
METLAAPDVALGQMRPVLMKFARMRLRNEVWAEDVVSETTIAALEQSSSFEARSQFQTWVIGILKHKIIDMQRRLRREVSIEAQIQTDELDDFDGLVQSESDRIQLGAPEESSDPESLAARRQFLHLMQCCIDRLPETPARAFVMRAWFEYNTNEVCAALSISRSNCNVMMFRTRARLRESIEVHDSFVAWSRRGYQRNNRGPSSAPAAAVTPIPATYQTARNGDSISGQRSA